MIRALNTLCLISLLYTFPTFVFGQDCADDEILFSIEFRTDDYGYEFTFELIDAEGNQYYITPDTLDYDNNTVYNEEFCLSNEFCYELILMDSYGDGFINDGYISFSINGEEIDNISGFPGIKTYNFNCPVGYSCTDALEISPDSYNQSFNEFWYLVHPVDVGIYEFTTCNNDPNCNTTIWIYPNCDVPFADDNTATINYNDDNATCGSLALLNQVLNNDRDYLIRVRKDSLCGDIEFAYNYLGPVTGCTDPEACNYNPLATVEDGSCYSFDDPECMNRPDLVLNEAVLRSSMYAITQNFDDNNQYNCLIEENCLKGVGRRDLIRFDTRIENIGQDDYFIGSFNDLETDQFTFDNCHNHWHYDGYAEYSLYDESGQYIPIGYKNGFCVLDLECPSQNMVQYDCDFMGITAGCADIYAAYLDCQWLDVTDIPDGNYVLLTVVNVDNAPDRRGRYELEFENNWAQACIEISRASGQLEFNHIEDCDPYVDCKGDLYGKAVPDCTGECDGTTIRGDINFDQALVMNDVEGYIQAVLNQDTPSECTDLHKDGEYNVYDASLLLSCLRNGETHNHPTGTSNHDHCFFPTGLYNHLDTMELDLVHEQGNDYFDINLRNPNDALSSFQMAFSGISIKNVAQNIAGETNMIFDIHINEEKDMIMGLSVADSLTIPRSNQFNSFLRIFVEEGMEEVCLLENTMLISDNDQWVIHVLEDNCFDANFTSNTKELDLTTDITIRPIPANDYVQISINANNKSFSHYTITDVSGKKLRYDNIKENNIKVDVSSWNEGIYFIHLSGNENSVIKKFVVHHDKK